MGLRQNTNSNVSYVRFKEGLFFDSRDKENGFNELEGYITNFSLIDEEWEGTPQRKLIIKLTDDAGENFIVKVPFESVYTTQLISFLKSANLAEKLSLVGMFKEDKEGKKRNNILVKQGGKFVKGFYTKDNPNGLPQMVETIVNRKKVWDKSALLEYLENVVVNEFNVNVAKSTPVKQKELQTADVEEDDSSELPF